MKILHLSDLHLGKSIYGVSLIDSGDQQTLVDNIICAVEKHKPDALVIAGDVYDRSNPSEGAVALFEQLLNRLMGTETAAFIISGNHDSARRLSYLNDTLKNHNIYIADELSSELESVTLEDEYGEVVFWLMPYTYPALISQVLKDADIKYKDYDAALRVLLENQNIDYSERNVLIAHQNVLRNGEEVRRGGSETSVGGVGGIEADAFANIEYTALGHIHAGYPVSTSVRYCGSPMCYHFDETRQKDKGALLIDIDAKGDEIKVENIAFKPLHPMKVLKGAYEEVKRQISGLKGSEYVKMVLTDIKCEHNVYANLRALISEKGATLLELVSEYNIKTHKAETRGVSTDDKTIDVLFDEFYYRRQNCRLDGKDTRIIARLTDILSRGDFDEPGSVDRAAEQLLDLLREDRSVI